MAIYIKAGFIGAGKVGCSLSAYFMYCGIDVTGIYARNKQAETDRNLFYFSAADDVVAQSDIIFITVTDSAIAEVWNGLDKTNISGKIICHCSGSLSSDIFNKADCADAHFCSLHPMQAFNSRQTSFDKLSKTFFTIEGDNAAITALSNILNKCGNSFCCIDKKDKSLYHAAAVFASNYIVANVHKAISLLNQCGFSDDDALAALSPMLMGNISAICKNGVVKALTGPIERNDLITIEKHLDCLDNETSLLYKALGLSLIEVAQKKHPNADYTELYHKLED